MRRAIYIIVAALLVLLSYPSTQSLAGPRSTDTTGPSIVTPERDGDTPIAYSGDGDDGDADDIAGWKDRGDNRYGFGAASYEGGIRTSVWMWWSLMIIVR